MKQTELNIYNLEQLNDAAEYIISSAQFTFPNYNEDGEYIWTTTHEELAQRIEQWHHQASSHPLCFRENEELHRINFSDALYMPLSEVKEKYLKNDLAKIRNILRKGTMDLGVVVGDTISDDYLDDLIALRWKENLKLWAIQWQHKK